MRAAAGAGDFKPAHAVAVIFVLLDGVRAHSLPEAWPAGPGFELLIGLEQLRITGNATVDPVVMVAIKRSCKCRLRALLTRDVILLGRKLRPPFGVGLLDFFHFGVGHRSILQSIR